MTFTKLSPTKFLTFGQVDRLCGQSGQPLPTIPVRLRVGGGATPTGLGPHPVLKVHDGEGKGEGDPANVSLSEILF